MRETLQALRGDILSYLAAPDCHFEPLAERLFRFQFANNQPYRAFCESLGLSPEVCPQWDQIPPVPSEAFRSSLPLSCCPVADCQRRFLTSGTTAEVRGRHYLADTALYEASIRRGWVLARLPTGLPTLFLSRDPALMPDSSLAFMFKVLATPVRSASSPWLVRQSGSIDPEPLEEACKRSEPILLFSTALALRHLFDSWPVRRALPAGSWIFQTGGYKGLSETYDPHALYRALEEHLGVPSERVINEYGMTELSTPSYAIGLGTPHRCPPWLRVRTIHPETNQPNPPGQSGHLVFFDLANLNSVAAVRTRDLGIALDHHHFLLEGRDPAAVPRGCSRASDAHLRRP